MEQLKTRHGAQLEYIGYKSTPQYLQDLVAGRLQVETARVLQLPEIRNAIIDGGSEVGGGPPEEFVAYLRADRERWKKAVADAGVTAE